MKAIVYDSFGGPLELREVPDPSPPSDGVVIEVKASGLCLSDWHGWKGHDPDIRLPHVPGHELSGIIVAVGSSVNRWQQGQRVTIPFVGGCGKCMYCREGDHQVCENQFQPGFTAWGSFAQYVVLRYADINLVALPERMEFVTAASLGCRFVTSYRAVVQQARLTENQLIAVHGCGGIGLSAILIAKAMGATVVAIDRNQQKCDFAKSLGADWVINSENENVVDAVRDFSGGGVHVSLDAVGHSSIARNSLLNLRKRGKHIQVGLMTGVHAEAAIPWPEVVANELEILGSHGIQSHSYPDIFEFIDGKQIDLDTMLYDTIRLSDVPKYLPELDQRIEPGILVIDQF